MPLLLDAVTTATVITELVNACTTVKTDVMDGLIQILPVGLAIAGTMLTIRICYRFFRSVAH